MLEDRMTAPALEIATMEPATVLIVDDNAEVREFASRCLRSHGYAVLEAVDGATALRLASDRRIDLLLTDVVMPKMDGRELARRFRVGSAGARVLFMSGYHRLDLPQRSLFLPKPFTAQALLKQVEEVFGRGTAVPSPGVQNTVPKR